MMHKNVNSGDVIPSVRTYIGGRVFFEIAPEDQEPFMVQYSLPSLNIPGNFKIPSPDKIYLDSIFQRREENPARSRTLLQSAKSDLQHLSDSEATALAMSLGTPIPKVVSSIDFCLDYKG